MHKSFILHLDSLEILDELSNEQAGILVKAFKQYHEGQEPDLDPILKMVFIPFRSQFIRDLKKYNKVVERNRQNGLKGGRPTESGTKKETQETQENPLGYSEPKKPYSDSKSDSDSDNKSDSIIVKESINERKLKFATLLSPFVGNGPDQYSRDLVKEFYDYWTEHGPNDKKFRKEKQTSFDISRRLRTFKKNETKFNKGSEGRLDRLANM
jgi:hypothetical protein